MPINPDYVGGFGRFSFGDDSFGDPYQDDDGLSGWQEYANAAANALRKRQQPKQVGGGLAVATVQATPSAPTSADYLNSTLKVAQGYLDGNAVTPKDNGPRVQPSGAAGSNVSFGMNPEYLAAVQNDPGMREAARLRAEAVATKPSRIFNADWTNRTQIQPKLERAAMLEASFQNTMRIQHPEWYQVQQPDVPVEGTQGKYIIRNGKIMFNPAFRPDDKPVDPKSTFTGPNGEVMVARPDAEGNVTARQILVPGAGAGPSPDGGHPAAPLIDPSRRQALEDADRKAALERELKGMETSASRAVGAGHDAATIRSAEISAGGRSAKAASDNVDRSVDNIKNAIALLKPEKAQLAAEIDKIIATRPYKTIPDADAPEAVRRARQDHYDANDLAGKKTRLKEMTTREAFLQGKMDELQYGGGGAPAASPAPPKPEAPDPASVVQRGAAEVKKTMAPPATAAPPPGGKDPRFSKPLGDRKVRNNGVLVMAHDVWVDPSTGELWWKGM